MPSVSKRVSIAWDGGIPSEDTETLVIVGNTYFVDVRIKKETGGLDWAMAGVKEWVHKGSGAKAIYATITILMYFRATTGPLHVVVELSEPCPRRCRP